MQHVAEDSGWLTIYHEWSWWYPWYRLHVKVHANPTIDVGFNPILPWSETCSWDGLEFFAGLDDEMIQFVVAEALGLIGTCLLAKYASIGSFFVGIGVETAKIIAQWVFLYPSWNSAGQMLASALMSLVMLVFVVTDFGRTASNFLVRIIDYLRWICGGVINMFTWILAKLKDMCLWGIGALSKWVDAMEAISDATLFFVACGRYNQLIHAS
jgi:hypothetical protein